MCASLRMNGSDFFRNSTTIIRSFFPSNSFLFSATAAAADKQIQEANEQSSSSFFHAVRRHFSCHWGF
jgi:hypothetical protein